MIFFHLNIPVLGTFRHFRLLKFVKWAVDNPKIDDFSAWPGPLKCEISPISLERNKNFCAEK
jgi:hypothetical protein